MTHTLEPDGEINLTTTDPSLKALRFGFGWTLAKGSNPHDLDVDVSAFLLNDEGRVTQDEDFVFYNNLTPEGVGVEHLGDKIEGDGDVEQIRVRLESVPFHIGRLAFSVSIHNAEERDQDLRMVQGIYMRLVNEETGEDVVRYSLPDIGEGDLADRTALVVAELCREGMDWKLKSLQELYKGELYAVCKHFGVRV